jgi:hypothetical protein
VIDAVRNGQFHIYPINYADEGIAILTGTPAGSADGKDRYPFDSVHGKVHRRLRSFYKRATKGED